MARVLEGTISGIDAGGFAWQNVFHAQTDDDAETIPHLLSAFLSLIDGDIKTPYLAALCDDLKILDLAARVLDPSPSYVMHSPQNSAGGRAGVSVVGALAAQIKFFPAGGTHTGRMFIPGSLIGDWINDKAQAGLVALLATLGQAFVDWNGTEATWHWQFGIWNKATPAFLPVVDKRISLDPTTLNKRMRA